MAKQQKDLLTRLADVGEEAFSRVAGSQTTTRVVDSITGLRERMDDLQRKMRGLDELEQRVAKLETQIAELKKPKTTRSRATTAKPAARKTSSPRKKPS
jgi:hypothetical protein